MNTHYITIEVPNFMVEKAAQEITKRLTLTRLSHNEMYGSVPSGFVLDALTSGWLKDHLQWKIDAALENLASEMMDLGSLTDITGFLNLLKGPIPGIVGCYEGPYLQDLDDVPDGCYCGTCLLPCKPEWYDSKDSWVPSCHPNSELHSHPSDSDEMEIDDILNYADGSDIEAYRRAVRDEMETRSQHS